ncbi:MAG: iron transporter [Isosphaeraceae bacterium]|nr:iron transporter [Isosphaeraceae bacterium]
MLNRWVGPLVTALIIVGVGAILLLNLNLPTAPPKEPVKSDAPRPEANPLASKPAGFREYPIGDEVLRNHMRIAAVWLPPIQMDGMPASSGADIIHLEADVKATERSPHGFAKDEFVPYLKIAYKITPAAGGPAIDQGDLKPMVAGDGLHYGASIAMPKKGEYRLTYSFQPPSAGGLGRHSDPVTGVAPWWEPFEVTFEWDDCPGPKK